MMIKCYTIYFVLSIIFLLLLNMYGEIYYFERFGIAIFSLAEIKELLFSQRYFTFWQQAIIAVVIPLLVCIIFIMANWIKETRSKSFFQFVSFLSGILPFLILAFNINAIRPVIILPIAFITMLLCVLLWIVVFHTSRFEIGYLCFHFFGISCVITGFMMLTGVDSNVASCLVSGQASAPHSVSESHSTDLYIGDCAEFNFYYDPFSHRALIERK